MLECLIKYGLLTINDKQIILSQINIITFIKSLKLNLIILDTEKYSRTNSYPEYQVTLINWENDSINGLFDSDKQIILSIKIDNINSYCY